MAATCTTTVQFLYKQYLSAYHNHLGYLEGSSFNLAILR